MNEATSLLKYDEQITALINKYDEQITALANEYVKEDNLSAYNNAAYELALLCIHREHLPATTLFNMGFLSGQAWCIASATGGFTDES